MSEKQERCNRHELLSNFWWQKDQRWNKSGRPVETEDWWSRKLTGTQLAAGFEHMKEKK
jgi:hypothetical protein